VGRAEGGGRHEVGAVLALVDVSEHGGRGVELAEPAAEAGAGDEAAPALADERGADEARGVVGRDAEETRRGALG
jgi:hypothetical protein